MTKNGFLILIILFTGFGVSAQQAVSLEDAVRSALDKHPRVRSAELGVRKNEAMKGAVIDLPKTDISVMYGQYNSINSNDNNITISQRFPFPSVFGAQRGLTRSRISYARSEQRLAENQIVTRVRRSFNQLLYFQEREALLLRKDSIFTEWLRIARIHLRTGEGTLLQVTAAESRSLEAKNELARTRADLGVARHQLALLCQMENFPGAAGRLSHLFRSASTNVTLENNPYLLMQKEQIRLMDDERRLETARALPEFEIGFFTQTLIGIQTVGGAERYFSGNDRFHGVHAGISVPLFFPPARARIKSAGYGLEMAEHEYADAQLSIEADYTAAARAVEKNRTSIEYYEETALAHADMLILQSRKSFEQGELSYADLLLNLQQALGIREGYIRSLSEFNESIISLMSLTGE